MNFNLTLETEKKITRNQEIEYVKSLKKIIEEYGEFVDYSIRYIEKGFFRVKVLGCKLHVNIWIKKIDNKVEALIKFEEISEKVNIAFCKNYNFKRPEISYLLGSL